MSGAKLIDAPHFHLASLIGLGTAEKIERFLEGVYGVDDRRVAMRYHERASALQFTTTELVLALLRLIPRTYVANTLYGESTAAIRSKQETQQFHEGLLRDVLSLTDTRHHEAIERAFASECESSDLLPDYVWRIDGGLIFDDQIDWRGYFTNASLELACDIGNKVMLAREKDGGYLIAAHHSDFGLLIGNSMFFSGQETIDGYAIVSPGFALYGPRRDFPAGFYFLDIDIEIMGDGELLLDVTSNCGLCKLFEIRFSGRAAFRHRLEIKATDTEMEVRIASEWVGPLYVRMNKILLTKK
jgi:hypothetical protein